MMRPSILRRWQACRSGVAAVEFALLLPALLMFVVGIVDIGGLAYAQAALEAGARFASRTGSTGHTDTTTNTVTNSTISQIQGTLMTYSIGGLLDFSKATIRMYQMANYNTVPNPWVDRNSNGKCDSGETLNGGACPSGATSTDGGGASQIIFYQIVYNYTPLTPFIDRLFTGHTDGTIPLVAMAVVRNEPWN